MPLGSSSSGNAAVGGGGVAGSGLTGRGKPVLGVCAGSLGAVL